MSMRLVVDLEQCDACDDCVAECDYFWRVRAAERGVQSLREYATFLLVCRRCEHASCAQACPHDALERDADGVMTRHNMRCVSCKTCVSACPFGTIYPELVAFYSVPCDLCAGRNGQPPRCARTCAHGGIAWLDVEKDDKEVHVLSEALAVRAPRWTRREAVAA
jgi:Fe-S-cluster-containing hydrogenase component 2